MNEIEYRAWHKTEHIMGRLKTLSWDKDGKLIGGFLVGVRPGKDTEPEPGLTVLAPSDGRFCPVGELEIMAFTGLRDKNGQKIFMGDILQYPMCHHYANHGVVVWEYDHYAIQAKRQIGSDSEDGIILFGHGDHEVSLYECEVIGNEWQQHELLGKAA